MAARYCSGGTLSRPCLISSPRRDATVFHDAAGADGPTPTGFPSTPVSPSAGVGRPRVLLLRGRLRLKFPRFHWLAWRWALLAICWLARACWFAARVEAWPWLDADDKLDEDDG